MTEDQQAANRGELYRAAQAWHDLVVWGHDLAAQGRESRRHRAAAASNGYVASDGYWVGSGATWANPDWTVTTTATATPTVGNYTVGYFDWLLPQPIEHAPAREEEGRSAARDERHRLIREEAARVAAEERQRIAAANAKAKELFLLFLTEEQRAEYGQTQTVTVTAQGSGKRYRVTVQESYGRHGNIRELDHDGNITATLCCSPGGADLPFFDAIIGQIMSLQYDEEHFCNEANYTYYRHRHIRARQ